MSYTSGLNINNMCIEFSLPIEAEVIDSCLHYLHMTWDDAVNDITDISIIK